jgi:enediyne biosynthesis protein E4
VSRGGLILLIALAAAACDSAATPPSVPGRPTPGAARPAASALPVFVDVAEQAGVAVENHCGKRVKDWIVEANGGGAIVLDYDQDGRMDLVVVDGTMVTESGDLEYDDAWRTRVFHNDGGMRFSDVTAKTGVDVRAFAMGGASCDYDGDGCPDFYVCCWGRNFLFRNKGDGTFEEVAAKAGVAGDEIEWSNGCCWGDVNADGAPDLYVANYLDQRAFIEKCRREGVPGRHSHWHGVLAYTGPATLEPQKDRLYLANGDGTFRDVTATHLGPQDPPRFGYQPIMTDVDGDGDLDAYVPNDITANWLWTNDGHGRFVDRGLESATSVDARGVAQASMGVDAADIDRDGRLDLVVTHLDFDHNTLYINRTERADVPSFRDMSNAFNVAQPSYLHVSWGTKLWDYDGDGEIDLFVACGHVYGDIDRFTETTGMTERQRCLLERNVGPPSRALEDVTDRGGPAFRVARVWRGAAFADFDDDGDLDVFVTALNDKAALFRNDGGDRNAFLAFRLVGTKPRDPAGARVTVTLGDGVARVEELHHGASFCGDNDPRLFFGLGAETAARRVDVRWPNGETQRFENVAARKFYVVEQGRAELLEDRR